MGEVSTIRLDIAKSIFQIHGVDVDGAVVIRKRVRRAKVSDFSQPCRRASWVLRRVRAHIIGAARFRCSAMR